MKIRLKWLMLAALLIQWPMIPVGVAQTAPKVLRSADHARTSRDFRSYWHRGLAEVNRFELQQSRYGELHEGEAVMVFVTEDFLTDRQVKHEFGPKDAAVPILKGLQYRRFWTGVYPYNITTTAFVPVKESKLLKLSFGQTDWCGQVSAQLNRTPTGLDVESRSYFQAEGDRDFAIKDVVTEDELLTRLRIGPDRLPSGTFQALPSLTYLRLNHKEIKPYKAVVTTADGVTRPFLEQQARTFTIEFPELSREVTYYFEPEFPYRILAFEETAPALFNPEGGAPETLTTRGILRESLMLDYWSKHGLGDVGYRKALGLKPL